MSELYKCVMMLSVYVLGTLFEMLVNSEELKECAAPLDAWVVGEVILLFSLAVSLDRLKKIGAVLLLD